MYVCMYVCMYVEDEYHLPTCSLACFHSLFVLLSRVHSCASCASFFLSPRSVKGEHPLFRRSIYVLRRKQMTGRIKTMAKSRQFSSLKLIYVIIIFNNAKKSKNPITIGQRSCLCSSQTSFLCRFRFFYIRLSGLTRVDRPATKSQSLCFGPRQFIIVHSFSNRLNILLNKGDIYDNSCNQNLSLF